MTNVYHVVPDAWGPFVDVAATLRAAGCAVGGAPLLPPYPDAVVYWGPALVPAERPWAAIAVYSEALDEDRDKMLPEHVAHLERFLGVADNYDAIVVHAPGMARRLQPLVTPPVAVVPLGWDPKVAGVPQAPRHVDYDVAWWGSLAGRRVELFPRLAEWCVERGVVGCDLTGRFGRDLIGGLSRACCAVYVAHSRVASYSTWRLWQCMAAGVPLVSEPTDYQDAWPFLPGEDFATVPFLDEPGAWDALDAAVVRCRIGDARPIPLIYDPNIAAMWQRIATQACARRRQSPAWRGSP